MRSSVASGTHHAQTVWLGTLTSPFSRGTIREYSVVQMTSSSCVMRSRVRGPNRSKQSLLEAMGNG